MESCSIFLYDPLSHYALLDVILDGSDRLDDDNAAASNGVNVVTEEFFVIDHNTSTSVYPFPSITKK